jgi:hypothetical protein
MISQAARKYSNQEGPPRLITLLLWGTFGSRTPAERRFIIRSVIGIVVALGWTMIGFVTRFRPVPIMIDVEVLLPGLILTYWAWEWRKYVLTLDELSRHILFEAAAWSSVTASVIAFWLAGVAVIVRWPHYPKLFPKVAVSISLYLFVGLWATIHDFYLRRVSRRYL